MTGSLTIIYGDQRVTLSTDQPWAEFRANEIRARELVSMILLARIVAARNQPNSSAGVGFESDTDQGG